MPSIARNVMLKLGIDVDPYVKKYKDDVLLHFKDMEGSDQGVVSVGTG